MRVENEGLITAVSFYLYGLVGLSLLVLISPLIVLAVPLLVVLGPLALAWWRGRTGSPRLGAAGRWWLAMASLLVVAMPVVPALWFLIDNNDESAAPESFWLLIVGIVILPFALAAFTYAVRWRRPHEYVGRQVPQDLAR